MGEKKKKCFYVRLSWYMTLVPLVLQMVGYLTPNWIILSRCQTRGLFYSCRAIDCCLPFSEQNNMSSTSDGNASFDTNLSDILVCCSASDEMNTTTHNEIKNITSDMNTDLLCISNSSSSLNASCTTETNVNINSSTDSNLVISSTRNVTSCRNKTVKNSKAGGWSCSLDESYLSLAAFVLETICLITLCLSLISYSVLRFVEDIDDDEDDLFDVFYEAFSVVNYCCDYSYREKLLLLASIGFTYPLSGVLILVSSILIAVEQNHVVLGYSFYLCTVSGIYISVMTALNIGVCTFCHRCDHNLHYCWMICLCNLTNDDKGDDDNTKANPRRGKRKKAGAVVKQQSNQPV